MPVTDAHFVTTASPWQLDSEEGRCECLPPQ